jgi:hypothetical protein
LFDDYLDKIWYSTTNHTYKEIVKIWQFH